MKTSIKKLFLIATVVTAIGVSAAAFATAHKTEEEPTVIATPNESAPDSLAIRPDKKYRQLNAAEKQSLRSMYKGLPDADEPPFPSNGYQPIIDQLLKIQEKTGLTGRIFATVRVDAKGVGSSVTFYELPDQRFSQVISFILIKNTQYKPAVCSGKPCAMDFPILVDLGRK